MFRNDRHLTPPTLCNIVPALLKCGLMYHIMDTEPTLSYSFVLQHVAFLIGNYNFVDFALNWLAIQ